MNEGELRTELAALRAGDQVTVVDVTGARFSGTVLPRRRAIDRDDEVGLRRSGGTTHWIKHDRIRSIER